MEKNSIDKFSNIIGKNITNFLKKTPVRLDEHIYENRHAIYNVFAGYGIIQVLAQDLGIKTGKKQRDLIQNNIYIQFLLFFSVAVSIMPKSNEFEALLACLLYFYLKYKYSNGKTSEVCFEQI